MASLSRVCSLRKLSLRFATKFLLAEFYWIISELDNHSLGPKQKGNQKCHPLPRWINLRFYIVAFGDSSSPTQGHQFPHGGGLGARSSLDCSPTQSYHGTEHKALTGKGRRWFNGSWPSAQVPWFKAELMRRRQYNYWLLDAGFKSLCVSMHCFSHSRISKQVEVQWGADFSTGHVR